MDLTAMKKRILSLVSRYRYAVLILVLGLVLVAMPTGTGKAQTPVPAEPEADTFCKELEALLSQVRGAGKVKLLLTEAEGARTYYQTDENASGESRKADTVILTDENRREQGLVIQVTPPVYQGAVVVCQGGDDPAVRLAIVQTLSKLTGLGSDRISVLKMK